MGLFEKCIRRKLSGGTSSWKMLFVNKAIGLAAAGLLAAAPAMAQFSTGGTTTTGTGTSTSTVPNPVPSPAAGTVPGGVQPPQPGSPSTANVAIAPTSIQLGPVQGLGGGIRPPRMTPNPGVPLSLDDAIRISLANNLNIFTAAAQETKAAKRVAETKAEELPRLGVNADYQYTGKVATATFGGANGQPGSTVSLGTHSNYGGSLTVSQPIDTSGAEAATVGIAQAQRDAQYWALDSARRQVILSVVNAYLQVLRSQDQLKVANEELTDAQAHVTLAQKLLAAGTIAQYDLLTAQTSLANVQQQVFSAQNNLNEAIADLDNAMGISQNTTPTLAALPPPNPTVPDFTGSLSTAISNRPELRQIDANIKTAQQSVKLADAGLKPTLALQADYNYTGVTSGFNNLHTNWTVGVVGSWDPFDFGATRDRHDESQQDVVTDQYLREQTSQGIEYQVRQAINQISDALQRRTAAESAVTTAREQLRLANVRFGAGVGTNTDVIDAEAALAQAETNSESALYDYYTALGNYQRATGTEPMAAAPLPPGVAGPMPKTGAKTAPKASAKTARQTGGTPAPPPASH